MSYEQKISRHFTRDAHLRSRRHTFGKGLFTEGGGSAFPHHRLVILILGLLNVVLLIAAATIGIYCVKAKESILPIPQPAAPLISELINLRDSHNDLIIAEKEDRRVLETMKNNHTELKVQLEHHKTINDRYQSQMAALSTEQETLHSTKLALEGSCGKCISRWLLLNSTCYYFSLTESSSEKKNWHDSREDCMNRGSDLAVIDNPEEQRFVSDKIKDMVNNPTSWTNGFWVGLTDIETEDRWVWINNVTEEEPRYWVEGEPNNHGHQGEDCGVVVYRPTNPWHTRFDAKCQEHQLHWLCEMPSK